METPRSIFRAPQQGQWLTSLDLKDAYFHIGSTQQTDAVLSQRHLLAVHSTVIRVVNQSESISKILKPVLAIAHLHRVKIALVHRRLVVKPRDTPGSSRANILAQVPVPKEVDQLVFRSGGIHSTAVTTCCPVAPSTWTPSLSWETSALWSRVAPMSDNTSAVAYLRNQGGHQIARNERLATELCLWSEKRGMTLVPCYLPHPTHTNFQARELRAFASSLAFLPTIP